MADQASRQFARRWRPVAGSETEREEVVVRGCCAPVRRFD